MESVVDSTAGRVLLVTDDVDLLDDLLRISAAAHVETEVAASARSAAARWSHAPHILVGEDLGPEIGSANLPRRPDVVLAGRGPDTPSWRTAAAVGADQVVSLPEAEPWLVDRFARLAVAGLPEGAVVGVVGARGGAGATTLAAALSANASNSGLKVAAVDLDHLGSGLDRALGSGATSGTNWGDLARARGRIPPGPLVAGFRSVGGVSLLAWGPGRREIPAPGAVAAVIDALRLACDLVVLDLPRCGLSGFGEATSRATEILLIAPRDSAAVASASQLLQAPELAGAPLALVTRGPSPGRMTSEEVVAALGLPIVADMRADPLLARDVELGLMPGRRRRAPLTRGCRSVLAYLSLPGGVR